MCNKIKYKDKLSAMFALSQCKNGKKGNRRECRFYFCNECNAYHLTSKKNNINATDKALAIEN